MGGSVGGSFEQFRVNRRGRSMPGLFGLSLISVMWAYDGFADLTFASGEVKDPQRNLPRAIIIGTLLIIADLPDRPTPPISTSIRSASWRSRG